MTLDGDTITRGSHSRYTPATRKRLLAANANRYRVPAWRAFVQHYAAGPINWRNVGLGLLVGAWIAILCFVALAVGAL